MVIPDSAAYDADRAPGLVRALHDTIADRPRLFRNLPALRLPRLAGARADALITSPCQDGYLSSASPTGATSSLYFEFDGDRATPPPALTAGCSRPSAELALRAHPRVAG